MAHEEGKHRNANSVTVCKASEGVLHDRHCVVERRQDSGRRAQGEYGTRDLLGDSSHVDRQGKQAKARTQADEEARSCLIIDPFSLPYVMMSELRYLPTCSGVYFVVEEGNQIAYIGQSANIRKRWRAHPVENDLCGLSNLHAARRVRIAWAEITDVDRLSTLERELICQYKPRLNDTFNRPERTTKPEQVIEREQSEPEQAIDGMISATEYAERIGKPYPTVAAWLRKGRIKGAVKTVFGKIEIWKIPEDAPYQEPPFGRPKGSKAKKTAKKAV
jgi:hypothetical protein